MNRIEAFAAGERSSDLLRRRLPDVEHDSLDFASQFAENRLKLGD
ncbi:hypothetical protein X742_26495 [Mesorhizobium sp. LNHC232B00]|nr:hypothetical protein X742_26495 [Mesorhizobium sp. LNHC232B00]